MRKFICTRQMMAVLKKLLLDLVTRDWISQYTNNSSTTYKSIREKLCPITKCIGKKYEIQIIKNYVEIRFPIPENELSFEIGKITIYDVTGVLILIQPTFDNVK